MSERHIRQLLRDSGAMVSGHFRLSSGLHAATYINKNLMMLKAADLMSIAEEIASVFVRKNIEVVAGPATGAIGLAVATAVALIQKGTVAEVLFCYAEKEDDDNTETFEFRRGFAAHIATRRVLVVEDILTTGASARAVVEAVRKAEGNVVGFSAVVNRGGVTSLDLAHPGYFHPLLNLDLPTFEPESCPQCKAGIPVSTVLGHPLSP